MPTGFLSPSSRLVLDGDDSWKLGRFSSLTPGSETQRFTDGVAASSSYLDVLQRVDLELRRADDVLRPRGRHGHQVQQPLAVLGPLGPLDVQRRFDGRLPQVVYLVGETSVSPNPGHCTGWYVSKNLNIVGKVWYFCQSFQKVKMLFFYIDSLHGVK